MEAFGDRLKNELKTELKTELTSGLRTAIKADIQEALKPIAVIVARHETELRETRDYMRANLVTKDEFHTRMDAFARRMDGFDHSLAKQGERLTDLERKLS